MLRRIIFLALVLLALTVSYSALAQAPNAPSAAAPSTQPDDRPRLFDELSDTELGRIIQGQRALTWSDIKQPAFWVDTIRNLAETLLAFIPRLIGTLIFLLVFWFIYRGIRKVVMGNMKSGEVDSSIRELLGAMIKWLVMGFGVVIACNQLGIPIVAMLTGVSLFGLAVGFAAQETLANFIAGIVIFLDKPLRINDWIEIGDTFGQVKRVTFRATRILTQDGDIVVMPNTQVLSSKLINHSTHPVNRISVPVGIAYKASIEDARRALLQITSGDERLMKTPSPEVVVRDLGDSSVNLLLRFWIEDESIAKKLTCEYTEKAKNALDAAGIEIPFPHMQLFIENTPAVGMLAGNGSTRSAN